MPKVARRAEHQRFLLSRALKKTAKLSSLISVVLTLALSGCSNSSLQDDPRNLTAVVSIVGSDTMAYMLKKWSAKFMETNPDVPVSVTSENTGSGISALIHRTTDLAAASREMTQSEVKEAASKGITIRKIEVARDSVAIIVNPKNPITQISVIDLKKLLAGQVRNWRECGGPSKSIELFTREEKSGTQSFIREKLLDGQEFSPKAQIVPSQDEAVAGVFANTWSVSYVGLGRALSAEREKRVKILALKIADKEAPILPTQDVPSDGYPLSRPLFIFADATPKPSVERFIQWFQSEAGQEFVSRSGYSRVSSGTSSL